MKAELIFITPEMAKEMLKGNIKNRRVKDHKVLEMAQLMIDGKWKSGTAEPIKISITGRLLDGQNRLHAVIKSGKTIEFLVVSELSDDVFDVLDTGSKRTASDTFYVSGIKNATATSAGIRYFNALNSNYFSGRGGQLSKLYQNSNIELLSEYNLRPEFWQHAFKLSQKLYDAFNRIFSQSELIGIYAYLFGIAPANAENFLIELCIDGKTNVPGILFARKLLIADKINIAKVPPKTKLAWLFNAWNVYRSGSKKRDIGYNAAADAFPIPK